MATKLPKWMPSPLTEEYITAVVDALALRERARVIARSSQPSGSSARGIRGLFSSSQQSSEVIKAYAATLGLSRVNAHKNRYTDVVAYDRTRVILPAHPEDFYINANWTREIAGGRWHISTQAPVSQSTHDFLSMLMVPIAPQDDITNGHPVQVQRPRTIVQLTPNFERGIAKASTYFPNAIGQHTIAEPDEGSNLSPIKVTLLSVVQDDDWVHSTLELSTTSKPGQVHIVRHLLFQGWPDHGVPHQIRSLLRFMKFVEACNVEPSHPDAKDGTSPSPPLVIHCSAGVGRTGTFIALLSLFHLHHLNQPASQPGVDSELLTDPKPAASLRQSALGPLDPRFKDDLIAQEVDGLREHRVMMVQTIEQLQFIYTTFVATWNLAHQTQAS